MEEANQSIEGEVVLRRDHHTSLIEPFKGVLAMKFGRVEKHERSVFHGVAERIEQPRRKPFA